jgi:hypothetical protein
MRRPGKVRAAPPAVAWMVGWLTLTCSRPEGRLRRVCAGVVVTAALAVPARPRLASTDVPLKRDSS